MKRKMRKFAEGGVTEGQNPNIDDDTRARALKFVENASEESRDIGAPVTRSASKSSSKVSQTVAPPTKAAPKPTPESAEEYKSRMQGLEKKQALESVSPEDYIPGGGILKMGLKAIAGAGARRAAKEGAEAATKQIGSAAAKQLENNATKRIGLDKSMYKSPVEKARESRASSRVSKMKQENYDAGPAGRARASGAMVDDLTPGSTDLLSKELRSDFKRGGSVKSSASRRADGCAIRGKTRA